jgi:hypothetical protein
MKNATRIALTFAAFAAMATAANAQGRGHGAMFGGANLRANFERADADKSGDVSYEEFAALFGDRFKKADADANGELTVEEIAAAIERMRAEQMAMRVMERLDANSDGKLTTAEIESQQKKLFALGDRNDDGKIAEGELPRRGEGRPGGRRGWFGRGDN